MHTDPLTGARYPDSSDTPNVSQYIQNAVNDLSGVVGGVYTTNTARDSAFTAWVNAGNSMKDGLRCTVAGYQQVYRSGSWRGVTPLIYSTTSANSTAQYGSAVVMTLPVPDPGWTYRLDITGSVLMQTVGASVNIYCSAQINGAGINPVGDTVFSATTQSNVLMRFAGALSGAVTGASTVTFLVNLNSAPQGNGYQPYANAPQNSLRALVVPL